MTPYIPKNPEAAPAAKWWADTLRAQPLNNNGPGHDAAFIAALCDISNARAIKESLTPEHIDAFESTLCLIIDRTIDNWKKEGSWRVVDPMFASAHRTISNDYGADRFLEAALDFTGVHERRMMFPIKTCMWITPGCVFVRAGYSSNEEVIYGEKAPR